MVTFPETVSWASEEESTGKLLFPRGQRHHGKASVTSIKPTEATAVILGAQQGQYLEVGIWPLIDVLSSKVKNSGMLG